MHEEISELKYWNKDHAFVLEVYECTQGFPKEETYNLTSQLRKAAVSIPTNIIEGRARKTDKDYQEHLQIARGYLEESRYQLLLAKDLCYITSTEYEELEALAVDVDDMLVSLINSLKPKAKKFNLKEVFQSV